MLCSRNKLHVRVNAIAQYECWKLEFLYINLRAMIASRKFFIAPVQLHERY